MVIGLTNVKHNEFVNWVTSRLTRSWRQSYLPLFDCDHRSYDHRCLTTNLSWLRICMWMWWTKPATPTDVHQLVCSTWNFLMGCLGFVQNLLRVNQLCYPSKFCISNSTIELKFPTEVVLTKSSLYQSTILKQNLQRGSKWDQKPQNTN